MKQASRFPLALRHILRNALFDLSNGAFIKRDAKDYITLDEGPSTAKNKNAISFLESSVWFMIGDWSWQAKALQLNLKTERGADGSKLRMRLGFPELTIEHIDACREFFKELTLEAEAESSRCQGVQV